MREIESSFSKSPAGYGGARTGAGRKPKGYVKPDAVEEFDIARARKESALADLHELSYKVKSGQYVERGSVQEASATLLAELGQSLRSLPDSLERKFNLKPDVVAEISLTIDEALNNISTGMAAVLVELEE